MLDNLATCLPITVSSPNLKHSRHNFTEKLHPSRGSNNSRNRHREINTPKYYDPYKFFANNQQLNSRNYHRNQNNDSNQAKDLNDKFTETTANYYGTGTKTHFTNLNHQNNSAQLKHSRIKLVDTTVNYNGNGVNQYSTTFDHKNISPQSKNSPEKSFGTTVNYIGTTSRPTNLKILSIRVSSSIDAQQNNRKIYKKPRQSSIRNNNNVTTISPTISDKEQRRLISTESLKYIDNGIASTEEYFDSEESSSMRANINVFSQSKSADSRKSSSEITISTVYSQDQLKAREEKDEDLKSEGTNEKAEIAKQDLSLRDLHEWSMKVTNESDRTYVKQLTTNEQIKPLYLANYNELRFVLNEKINNTQNDNNSNNKRNNTLLLKNDSKIGSTTDNNYPKSDFIETDLQLNSPNASQNDANLYRSLQKINEFDFYDSKEIQKVLDAFQLLNKSAISIYRKSREGIQARSVSYDSIFQKIPGNSANYYLNYPPYGPNNYHNKPANSDMVDEIKKIGKNYYYYETYNYNNPRKDPFPTTEKEGDTIKPTRNDDHGLNSDMDSPVEFYKLTTNLPDKEIQKLESLQKGNRPTLESNFEINSSRMPPDFTFPNKKITVNEPFKDMPKNTTQTEYIIKADFVNIEADSSTKKTHLGFSHSPITSSFQFGTAIDAISSDINGTSKTFSTIDETSKKSLAIDQISDFASVQMINPKKSTTNKNYAIDIPDYTATIWGQPEENYEISEAVSVMSNGRAHGTQPSNTDEGSDGSVVKPDADSVDVNSEVTGNSSQVGYVAEGDNFRKYLVEQRTSDGYIVGEYGVVHHEDNSVLGVRYTADGNISPKLIYETLMKFLNL